MVGAHGAELEDDEIAAAPAAPGLAEDDGARAGDRHGQGAGDQHQGEHGEQDGRAGLVDDRLGHQVPVLHRAVGNDSHRHAAQHAHARRDLAPPTILRADRHLQRQRLQPLDDAGRLAMLVAVERQDDGVHTTLPAHVEKLVHFVGAIRTRPVRAGSEQPDHVHLAGDTRRHACPCGGGSDHGNRFTQRAASLQPAQVAASREPRAGHDQGEQTEPGEQPKTRQIIGGARRQADRDQHGKGQQAFALGGQDQLTGRAEPGVQLLRRRPQRQGRDQAAEHDVPPERAGAGEVQLRGQNVTAIERQGGLARDGTRQEIPACEQIRHDRQEVLRLAGPAGRSGKFDV